MSDKKPTVYHRTHVQNEYDFYLSRAVEDPERFIEAIQIIATAKKEDKVNIYLNTPGGRLDTTIQLINAIRNSEAEVCAHIMSECHSAGTFIVLACDTWVVHPHILMMFHNYSGGIFGKGNELVSRLEAEQKWFEAMCRDIYVPFLSEEEVTQVLNGKDLWFMHDDVVERLEVVEKAREEEREAAHAESRKALIEAIHQQDESDNEETEEEV